MKDQIISMKRRETKDNHRPMWEASTASGLRIYIVRHETNPARDQAHFFDKSGHGVFMEPMALDQVIGWQTHPIEVELYPDGDFWKLASVKALGDGEGPDTVVVPNGTLARRAAVDWAIAFTGVRNAQYAVWDTETTGKEADDEILSVGIVIEPTYERLSYMIEPENLDRVERLSHIHGIRQSDVVGMGKFPDYYPLLHNDLNGVVWAVYNSSFDPKMLEQVCLRHNLPPILPLAVVDVMQMFARFYGEWDVRYGCFKSHKLEEAAQFLGIKAASYHSAIDDATTTAKVIEAMAQWRP